MCVVCGITANDIGAEGAVTVASHLKDVPGLQQLNLNSVFIIVPLFALLLLR